MLGYPLGASDEKGLVQLFFQDFNGLAYSRLGNKKLFGSFRETKCNGYVIKYLV